MYFVAIYQDWYATVPACWILLKTKSLLWPPKNCDATAESKRSTEPSDDWVTIRYTRLVGPFGKLKPSIKFSHPDYYENDYYYFLKGTYEEARTVEIPMPDMSANNEEALEGMASGPQKLPEQSDDDNDELIYDEATVKKSGSPPISEMPRGYMLQGSQRMGPQIIDDSGLKKRKLIGRQESMMPDNRYNNHRDIHGTMSTIQLCRNMLQNPPVEVFHQSVENTDSLGVEAYYGEDPSTSYARPSKTWNVPSTNTSTQHRTSERRDDEHDHKQCCKTCRRTIEEILRKVDAILVCLKGDANVPQTSQDLSLLPQFPTQNLEQLDYLNRILAQDATARAQYMTMVKNIGGKDPKKHMRQALSLVLSDELSCKLSWTGQKNSIRAKDMKCIELLIGTMINIGKTTMYDMQEVVQRWLQHASDRVRYNDKKNNYGF